MLYISFSEIESFGLTPLEAMACDTPVIMPWNSALPEIYGRYPGFFDPLFDSVESISNLIIKSIDDAAFRKQLTDDGYRFVKYFSWKKTGEKFAELFRQVIKK